MLELLRPARRARVRRQGPPHATALPQDADPRAAGRARARDGQRVVRLKGGDPFVFGRGGEELQVLVAAEAVPGRGRARHHGGLRLRRQLRRHPADAPRPARHAVLLPGHFADDETAPDWAALAQPQQTRVFYMGVRRLRHIAAELQRHEPAGRHPGGAGVRRHPARRRRSSRPGSRRSPTRRRPTPSGPGC
ncbi:MAG: SAM-dependent methyltransferase [Comamonadaceae bacterium]|nr:SAM-dependent methyltransferase [Comamonadaceae bacterium]